VAVTEARSDQRAVHLQAVHIITTVPSVTTWRPSKTWFSDRRRPAARESAARAAVQDLQAAHIIAAVPSCSRRGGRPGPGSRIGGGRRRGNLVAVTEARSDRRAVVGRAHHHHGPELLTTRRPAARHRGPAAIGGRSTCRPAGGAAPRAVRDLQAAHIITTVPSVTTRRPSRTWFPDRRQPATRHHGPGIDRRRAVRAAAGGAATWWQRPGPAAIGGRSTCRPRSRASRRGGRPGPGFRIGGSRRRNCSGYRRSNGKRCWIASDTARPAAGRWPPSRESAALERRGSRRLRPTAGGVTRDLGRLRPRRKDP
jgi:hypothetical protein